MDAANPFQWLEQAVSTRGLVALMNFLMWYGNTTILLMAAVMGIDPGLYEASEIDGASSRKQFFRITLPLIRPILVYVVVTSMIGGIQMFDVPQILTNGKGTPDRASMTLVMFLNNHLFSKNYGMGGAISVAGNKNRVAEFNIFVDPEAAETVLQFEGVPKTLVPLDTCNHIQMSLKDFEQVQDRALRTLLLKMMRPYITNLRNDAGVGAALMYDPLTVFFLLQPESCRTVMYNLQVETKSKLTRGMTVADRRNITDGLAPNVTVVMDINATDFVNRFVDVLNGSRAAP